MPSTQCGITGADCEDDCVHTFRHSGAIGAVAAWSRTSPLSSSPTTSETQSSRSASRAVVHLPMGELAPRALSPPRDQTPTAVRWSVGRDSVDGSTAAPPASSDLFADSSRAPKSTNTIGCHAPESVESVPTRHEGDHTSNTLDGALRLAQAQRERLEALLLQQRRRPSPELIAVTPTPLSPVTDPSTGFNTRTSDWHPAAAPSVSNSPSCESAAASLPYPAERVSPTEPAVPSASHSEGLFTPDASTVCSALHLPHSGLAVALSPVAHNTCEPTRHDWRARLALIERLRRSPQPQLRTVATTHASAMAAYQQRGLLQTPDVHGLSANHSRPCVFSWDAVNSGNVLIGEDGVVAVAEPNRAFAEIAREYGTGVTQAPQLALVPMYSIGTTGVSGGHLEFSVRLWTVTPAPLAPAPHSHPVRRTQSRFGVGVAASAFKGPHTATPSFLFWSDGSAVATVDGEAATVSYGVHFSVGDEVTVLLDMEDGCLAFAVNGTDCGTAFQFVLSHEPTPLFPVVVFTDDGDAATLVDGRFC